jgi:hypothetical protein
MRVVSVRSYVNSIHLQLLFVINPLNELNSICHLLALLGTHHILHVSRIRVKISFVVVKSFHYFIGFFNLCDWKINDVLRIHS